MNYTKDTVQKQIEWISLVIWLGLCALSIMIDGKFVLGVFLGGLICIANYRLLSKHARKAVALSSRKAPSYMVIRFLFRITVTGLVLLAILVWTQANVVGLIIGLSVVMLSIVSYAVYTSIFVGGS